MRPSDVRIGMLVRRVKRSRGVGVVVARALVAGAVVVAWGGDRSRSNVVRIRNLRRASALHVDALRDASEAG